MAKNPEMPPSAAEQKPEEAQESAPEMAVEEEMSPEEEEFLKCAENFDQQRIELLTLERRRKKVLPLLGI